MNLRHFCKWCMVTALATLGANLGMHKASAVQPGEAGVEQGVQVLTRGPVHEAFAEIVTFDPEPGIVVPKRPPAAIEELPPDQRPEGANVAWIPGYWGWDDERSDFLWLSGIWRDLPPDRQWVPGYWGKSAQGFQWTSGYWADARVTEVQYLPEPPATAEAGPNVASPSPDNMWLPGCWMWQNGRYAWRRGIWATVHPDWNWVPAHYLYAPRGYVFVDGYWDYSADRRGVLFAPVYFTAGVYTQPGFSYSPTTVINPAVFANHLFLRPQYQHYYFGDYYAANYQAAGFYPSYLYNSGHFGYDPIYVHERWQHRQDNQWEHRVAAEFQNRRDYEDARPPRTWAAQREIDAHAVQSRERGIVMAAPLAQLVKATNSPLRFQPVEPSERREFSQHAQEVHRFREERQKLETNVVGAPAETRTKEFVPPRVRLPGSPIAAKPVADSGKYRTPPKTYEAPELDPNVAAKPRVNRSPGQSQQRTLSPAPLGQPQPQPKAERPQPKVERSAPQPQSKAERPAPPPDKDPTGPSEPKAERSATQPQPQPKVERSAPPPQPKAERPAPPRDKNPAGPSQDQRKGKGKD